MGRRRPTNWWWSDWMADRGVRSVSLAARGLWIDMLALMADGNPVGHLTEPNGKRMSPSTLARQIGADPEEILPLLEELNDHGVYSRTKGGLIYCRRMVRDERRSRVARESGALGGNPALLASRGKKKENPPLDKGAAKGEDNHTDNPPFPYTKEDIYITTTSPSAARTHARTHEDAPPETEAPSPDGGAGGGGDERDGGVGTPHGSSLLSDIEALVARAWGAARTRHRTDEDTVTDWLGSGLEPEEILHRIGTVAVAEVERGSRPPTALRFFDRAVRQGPAPETARRSETPGTSPIQWDARVRTFRTRQFWLRDHWGPPPGERGCWAPADTLRKHGYG